MKLLSSPMTFFWKRVYPTIWLGGVALFLVFGVSSGAGFQDPIFLVVPLIMLAVGTILFKTLVWNLVDAVYDAGDSLVIRNKGRKHVVPLSEIKNVSATMFMNPPRITLRLANPGELGADVRFMLPRRFFLNPFAKSKVAVDLIERVGRARRGIGADAGGN